MLQMMFYVDFKHMMTRRLAGNASASFDPVAANTVWHTARDPAGPPATYADAQRSVSAADLAKELAQLDDQHAIYLNAVPLITDTDSKEVTEKLPAWIGHPGTGDDAPLSDRVQRYVSSCKGLDIFDDEVLRPLLEQATAKS